MARRPSPRCGPGAGLEDCSTPRATVHPGHTLTSPALRTRLTSAVVAVAASAVPCPAQDEGGCAQGRIAEIFVDNGSVFSATRGNLDARFGWAYRLGNRLHIRTRESVIRRELLFREGDCLSPAVLEDSERILRAASFMADVDVFAVPQPDGTVHVVVQTRDEWSFRLEPQLQGGGAGVTGLEVREDNLFGMSHRVAGWVREEDGERVFGAEIGTRQLAGTHLDADLRLERTPAGTVLRQRIGYPFRGEGGQWAFRQQAERSERNFVYWAPDADGRLRRWLFPEFRRTVDVGAVRRFGRRGQLTLFGLAVAGEWTEYPSDSLQAPEDRQPRPLPPGGDAIVGLDSLSTLRVVALAGQRNVRFDRRRGLDAVAGSEDVRIGFDVELGVGRSLPSFSDDDDLAFQVGIDAAGDVGRVFAGVRAVGEAQHDFGGGDAPSEWRNAFGQVDAWAYWRPGPESRHTWVLAAAADGGWNAVVPFQLTLGSRAGLRGFSRHVATGQRRMVATLEHRALLGWPYPRLFDLGSAAFVDAGRIWPGGDPFAQPEPIFASVGAGLRAAFPAGSRRTYRVDVAVPVAPAVRPGSVEVTFAVGQAVGRGGVEEHPQLRRSARRALSASVFSFPN